MGRIGHEWEPVRGVRRLWSSWTVHSTGLARSTKVTRRRCARREVVVFESDFLDRGYAAKAMPGMGCPDPDPPQALPHGSRALGAL